MCHVENKILFRNNANNSTTTNSKAGQLFERFIHARSQIKFSNHSAEFSKRSFRSMVTITRPALETEKFKKYTEL